MEKKKQTTNRSKPTQPDKLNFQLNQNTNMNPELIDNGLRRDVVDTKQQANAFHEKYVERFTHTSSLTTCNISLTTPNIFSQIKILPATKEKKHKTNRKKKQNITRNQEHADITALINWQNCK